MRKKTVIEKGKKMLTAILAGTLVLGITGCGASGSSGDGSAQVLSEGTKETEISENETETDHYKTVRIVSAGADASGNITMVESSQIAYKKNYIEEELNKIGYTAEYLGFQNAGVGANEALAAKEADIAFYGEFPVLTYIASGNEATIFGVTSSRNQIGVFATDDIQSISDLKGKKICTMFGTVAYQYLVKVLEENDLTTEDVEIVNSSDAGSLFISGEVDAIVNSPQAYWTLAAQGAGHQISVNGDSENLSTAQVILGRNEYLEENPEVAGAITKALERAEEYAKENPEEVYQVFASASNGAFTEENYKDYYGFDTSFSFWSPYLTEETVIHLQDTADFMFENKYIQSELVVKDLVNTELIAK